MLALPCLFFADARSDPAAAPAQQTQGFLAFVDQLPELVDRDLPFFAPRGTYWFYARPSIGNPFQGKYFRLDGGAWVKVTKSIDFNVGAQSYAWRDQTANDATRWGFYGANAGLKFNRSLPGPSGTAMSTGLNFFTPISEPPLVLTDGYRHTDAYMTYTRPLSVHLHLVGFATLGADLLAHYAPLPSNFGDNQLHSNSLNGSLGATREFKYFTASTTVNGATTAVMSKHALQVFSINPRVIIPVEHLLPSLCARLPHWHFNLNLGAHAATGPDGRQFGGGASMSVNFDSRK
jgi:hypothetical protein